MKIKDLKVDEAFLLNAVPFRIKVYFEGSPAIVECLHPPYTVSTMEEEVEVEFHSTLLQLSKGDTFSFEGKVYTLKTLSQCGEAVAIHNASGNSHNFNSYCQVVVQGRK